MSIVFYEAPMSSATPVAFALGELAVPHERATLNFAAGDTRKPEFLALNPNGKVPTLVVDGTPIFEALGIMLWLAERYGVPKGLWPKESDPARLTAMAWSTWTYVTLGNAFRKHFVATSPHTPADLHVPAVVNAAKSEIADLLTILDARLAKRAYMLGDVFSMLDVISAPAVGFGMFSGADVASHKHVKAWLDRVMARPAYQATLAPR